VSWQFRQSTGEVIAPDGEVLGSGYSGHGPGVDNPADQAIPNVGPIPVGQWIIGPLEDGGHLGPDVLPLFAAPGTETFGRTGFFIHGDNAQMNHTGSEGCLVLPRAWRILIGQSTDRTLVVLA